MRLYKVKDIYSLTKKDKKTKKRILNAAKISPKDIHFTIIFVFLHIKSKFTNINQNNPV